MMIRKESIEFFSESMKKAADRARQLSKLTKYVGWKDVAISLDNLRATGEILCKKTEPTQKEKLQIVEAWVGKEAAKESVH